MSKKNLSKTISPEITATLDEPELSDEELAEFDDLIDGKINPDEPASAPAVIDPYLTDPTIDKDKELDAIERIVETSDDIDTILQGARGLMKWRHDKAILILKKRLRGELSERKEIQIRLLLVEKGISNNKKEKVANLLDVIKKSKN